MTTMCTCIEGPSGVRRSQQSARPSRARRCPRRAEGCCTHPDYCVNAGGLIQVADELAGFSFERAKTKADAIYDTTKAVFAAASAARVTPERAADQMAEDRMREVGRLREIWLG